MPTMNIKPMGSLINVPNGATRTFVWDINLLSAVRSFSVTPFMIDVDSGGIGMWEITKVQYIIKKTAPTRQIWITVKNTGAMMLNCDLWVSWVQQ